MRELEAIGRNNPEEVITDQYKRVAGVLSMLFEEVAPRTVYHVWRQDGVGSCRISTSASEKGIEGPAKRRLIELRNEQQPNPNSTKCGFHVEGKGCKLTGLRGPYCLEHIDASWELKKRFSIDGYQLTREIRWILQTILLTEKPENNEDFTKEAINAIEEMKRHIKKFPLAKEEEIQKWVNPRFLSDK